MICACHMQLTYIASRSPEDEVARSITKDMHLVAAAGVIFLLTAVAGLTKCDSACQSHMHGHGLSSLVATA